MKMVSNAFSAAKPDPWAGGTRVAVIDLVKTFNEFKQTLTLNKRMDEKRKKIGEEADHRQEEMNADKTALDAFAPDSADWFKRSTELKKKTLEYEIWQRLELDALGEHHLRWTKRTYEMVTSEVARIAQKHNIQLVVTREELDMPQTRDTQKLMQAMLQQILGRKVVYSDPAIEITEEVLTALNEAFDKAGGEKALDPSK
jgi:Skp family chaperone for outer membrane proteins